MNTVAFGFPETVDHTHAAALPMPGRAEAVVDFPTLRGVSVRNPSPPVPQPFSQFVMTLSISRSACTNDYSLCEAFRMALKAINVWMVRRVAFRATPNAASAPD